MADSGWTIDRILLALALSTGAVGAGMGVFGTTDRFYGEQGRALEVKINYLDREIKELRQDIRRLDDNHPPEALLQDVGELRQRVRQLENERQHTH